MLIAPATCPDGGGSIVSTPNDMARFIQALFDGKIVSKENLDLMKTMRDGDGSGMEPFTFAGKTFYGHTGGGDNYGSVAGLPAGRKAGGRLYDQREDLPGRQDRQRGCRYLLPQTV